MKNSVVHRKSFICGNYNIFFQYYLVRITPLFMQYTSLPRQDVRYAGYIKFKVEILTSDKSKARDLTDTDFAFVESKFRAY